GIGRQRRTAFVCNRSIHDFDRSTKRQHHGEPMIVRSQRGMTLIELVVAIVVISMAAGTIIGLLAFMSRSSAEGMARVQSAAIANAYLQDILRRDFDTVDGFDGRVD